MDKPKCEFKHIDYVGYEEIPCGICIFKSNEEFEEFEDTYCFFEKEEECPVYKMSKRIEKLEKALDEIKKIDKAIELINRMDKECEEEGCSFVNLIEVIKIKDILKEVSE